MNRHRLVMMFLFLLGIAASAWAAPSAAPAAVPVVWITDSLSKVHAEDGKTGPRTLTLSGGRNSFIDLQVHVRAAATPVKLSIAAGNFTATSGTGTIAASRNIVVYREAYLDITSLSDAHGRTGRTPDPLVPAVDPYFHQARNAFPVTVPANTTQSVWIDVFVPAGTRAGTYRGTITVRDGATVIAVLKPVIKVWNFTLPATATLASAFGMEWDGLCVAVYGSYENCSSYPGAGGNSDTAIDLTHIAEATLLLDHRVSIDGTVYYGPPLGGWAHHDSAYGAALNGTLKTILASAALTSSEFFYPGNTTAANIRNWVNHYKSKGWLAKLFDYTCDEPPAGCSWAALRTRAQAMHAGSPLMATLVTTDIAHATAQGLLDLVDILTPVVDAIEPHGKPNQRAKYDAWLTKPNKRLWWYQSCDEHESCSNGTAGGASSTWPSYMVDATPVRNRVFQWLAYLDRIGGELYYAIDYCWAPGRCPGNDPWHSVYAFGGNGDGTLIYPGTVSRIGGTMPIALPSIRLKLIRDGMQDYEMLHALAVAGHASTATAIARGFIHSATAFNNDPAVMAAAREALGNALESAQAVHH